METRFQAGTDLGFLSFTPSTLITQFGVQEHLLRGRWSSGPRKPGAQPQGSVPWLQSDPEVTSPEDGMWESPTPALGGFIRVSSWRPQDLALELHTGVGGNRNNDQVLVQIRISELPPRLAGLGRSGAGVVWRR